MDDFIAVIDSAAFAVVGKHFCSELSVVISGVVSSVSNSLLLLLCPEMELLLFLNRESPKVLLLGSVETGALESPYPRL